jgi:hypothetical protein
MLEEDFKVRIEEWWLLEIAQEEMNWLQINLRIQIKAFTVQAQDFPLQQIENIIMHSMITYFNSINL